MASKTAAVSLPANDWAIPQAVHGQAFISFGRFGQKKAKSLDHLFSERLEMARYLTYLALIYYNGVLGEEKAR